MPELHEFPEGMPHHLGGGEKRCHDDKGTLQYMIDRFNIKSMIDIGCGRGCQLRVAKTLGLNPVLGIEGDKWLSAQHWGNLPILIHDYTTGPSPLTDETFDLAWTVEFLEHVEEKYIPNYFPDLQRAKYVVCTFAPPGKEGHHHVNCQPYEYWLDVFINYYNFSLIEDACHGIRKMSTMRKHFIRNYGLVFKNNNL
jgi:hypothetical protein